MRYLFAIALLLSTPALAGPKTDDALAEVAISYAKMAAGGVTCDLSFPKDARRRVVYAMATTGSGGQAAGAELDRQAEEEVRRLQANCTEAVRKEHGNWIRSFERDFQALDAAITQETR